MAKGRRKALKIILGILILILLVLAAVGYFRYLDLKKALVQKISQEMSAMIGQTVRIGDLSIRFPAAISFDDVRIENPKDFPEGPLLQTSGLRLNLRIKPLLKREFSFQSINLVSPELTLTKNAKGRWNLSEEMMRLLTEKSDKSARKYQIDELRITSGRLEVNVGQKVRVEKIDLRLVGLSSVASQRTSVKGKLSYAGNEVKIEGWVSLYAKPNDVNLMISSDSFRLSSLTKSLAKSKLVSGEIEGSGRCKVEGNIEKGFHLSSDMRTKAIRSSLLAREMKELHLTMESTLSLPRDSLVIHTASLFMDGHPTLSLMGNVTGLSKKPAYRAEVKIEKLDLSQLALSKDLRLGGIVTSRRLMIAGTLEAKPRVASGSLNLDEGHIEMPQAVMIKVNADIDFSFDKKMSTKVEATGSALRAGEYVFKKPVEARISALLEGTPEHLDHNCFFGFSPLEVVLKGNETVRLDSTQVTMKGTFKRNVLSAQSSLEIRGMQYADYGVKSLKSSSTIHYEKNEIAFQNFKLEADELKASIPLAKIKPSEKTGLGFEAIGLDLAFRDLKAFFAKLDAQLKPAEKKPGMSGDIVFSEGQITFRGNSCTHLSGSAKLEDKEATLVVSQAQMFGGRMQLAAQGQVSSVPFPVKLNLLIEEMDLGLLSKSDLIPWKLPLGVTGKLKKVSVDGILQTRNSFQGQSLLEIEKLSASDSTKGRNLVKDVSLHGQIEWLGKDLSFKGDTGSGPLSAQFSGTMKDFVDNGRSIQLIGVFPEIEVAKLRETFWDVFPDSLLYVGLNGSVSLETIVDYRQNDFAMSGSLTLKDLSLEGENGEYAIGPVNGIVPIAYRKGGNEAQAPPFPSFEKSQFDRLIRSYSKEPSGKGLHKLSLGSFRYGFQLLEDIQLWVEQKGSLLHVEQFSANIFGGRLAGSATVDLSNGIQYRAGLLIKGLSLTALCNSIPPIKGFISGRLDGIASLKGDRTGLSGLMGMGDFWTYEAGGEKTIISKEFLQKLGSQPAMQIYLRDRPFNKGTMSVYLKDGFLVFRELEISNRNFFGIKDLSVSVAPLSNRIAFDHLLSTVAQAAERVKQTNQ